MRMAVICFAYVGDPTGIGLLAEYFTALGADLYVHVDRKVEIAPYAALPSQWPNLHLLTSRTEYFWGGFNGVRAVVGALLVASRRADYDRYLYITEDTAPLLTTATLLERLSWDAEFFNVHPSDQDWVRRRYDGFFHYDNRVTNPRLVEEGDQEITTDFLHAIGRLSALRNRGKYPLQTVFHGPAYFGLSARAVAELLQSYSGNVHLRDSFEFSAIPEEQYFHSVLGGSRTDYVFQPFILMDMSGSPAPFIYRTAAELVALQAQGVPFARKMDATARDIADFIRRLILPPAA